MKKSGLVIGVLVISILIVSASLASASWIGDFWARITGDSITGKATYADMPKPTITGPATCIQGQECEGIIVSSSAGSSILPIYYELWWDYYSASGALMSPRHCGKWADKAVCTGLWSNTNAAEDDYGVIVSSGPISSQKYSVSEIIDDANEIDEVRLWARTWQKDKNSVDWHKSGWSEIYKIKISQAGGGGGDEVPFPVPTPPAPNITCTDSDGGLDYYVKGTASDSRGVSDEDYCEIDSPYELPWPARENILFESYCDTIGYVTSVQYTCPSGLCQNGACKEIPARVALKYALDLVSCSDTVATIKVTNPELLTETKEITEGTEKIISDLTIRLDQINVAANGDIVAEISPKMMLSSDSTPIITLSIKEENLNFELISASDISATIKITDQDGLLLGQKEITEGEGNEKRIGDVLVFVESADEAVTFDISATIRASGIKLSLTEAAQTCTDSDGGLDYYVKGEVRDYRTGFYDYCVGPEGHNLTGSGLTEWYCRDNEATVNDYICPNGCSDGACKEEPSTCTPRYYCTIKPATCPESGVQKKNCEDFECGAEGYAEEIACNPGQCSGCELEGACYPYGFRTEVDIFHDETGMYKLYCDMNGELKEQKAKYADGTWAQCLNNFECRSNVCTNDKCVEINDLVEKANIWKAGFVKFVCRIAHPLSSDEYNQCIYEYLEKLLLQ